MLRLSKVAGFYGDTAIANEVTKALAELDAAGSSRASSGPVSSGSGGIPDGTYNYFSSATATFLAGGRAALNPGQSHRSIVIKGDQYLYGDNPWGHYRVGPGGKIIWSGGAYSAKTLGRYAVDEHGTPTIAIGWEGVDVGNACRR
jgi:hypothetical protein